MSQAYGSGPFGLAGGIGAFPTTIAPSPPPAAPSPDPTLAVPLTDLYPLGAAGPVVSQASINAVGSIGSGVWNGTAIAVAHGGTGHQSVYTDGQLLIGNSVGATLGVSTLTAGTNIGIVNGHASITINCSLVADESTLHLSGSTLSIISTYTGQSSITTLGTITTGTWHGTIVGQAYGGTGLDTSAVTDGQILIGQSSDHSFGLATLTAGSNVTITNSGHSITIASTNSGGTVTSITAGTGLSGGTITTSGTIAFDPNSLALESVPALGDYLAGYSIADAAVKKFELDYTLGLLPPAPGGRLSLSSGTPVTTTDQTGKTVLYYVLRGETDKVTVWDGTRWKVYLLAEKNITNTNLTASLPYDVFLYDAGLPAQPAVRATTTGTFNVSNAVTLPTRSSGDLLVVFVFSTNFGANPAANSPWIRQENQIDGDNNDRIAVYYKTSDGTDSTGPLSANVTNGGYIALSIKNAAPAFDQSTHASGVNANTAITANSVTTTGPNPYDLLICGYLQNSGTGSITVPGSQTATASVTSPNSAGKMIVGYEGLSATGATGTRTATGGANVGWAALTFAVKPTAVGITMELNAWTNATTRATNVTIQDGRYCKSGDKTRLYVGTVYVDASGNFNDSAALRHVWNMYNRVQKSMLVTDSTANWTYSTNAFQQARASSANQLSFVRGLDEDAVHAEVIHAATNSTSTSRNVYTGIGLDNTTAVGLHGFATAISNAIANLKATYDGYPGAGLHTLLWLEAGAGADTQTWYGTNSVSTLLQNGISGYGLF